MDTLARDLMERLELDKRLRAVEQAVAGQDSTLKAMLAESNADRIESRDTIRAMEARLMGAIDAARPQRPWTAISAMVATVALILLIAQQLYGVAVL